MGNKFLGCLGYCGSVWWMKGNQKGKKSKGVLLYRVCWVCRVCRNLLYTKRTPKGVVPQVLKQVANLSWLDLKTNIDKAVNWSMKKLQKLSVIFTLSGRCLKEFLVKCSNTLNRSIFFWTQLVRKNIPFFVAISGSSWSTKNIGIMIFSSKMKDPSKKYLLRNSKNFEILWYFRVNVPGCRREGLYK